MRRNKELQDQLYEANQEISDFKITLTQKEKTVTTLELALNNQEIHVQDLEKKIRYLQNLLNLNKSIRIALINSLKTSIELENLH